MANSGVLVPNNGLRLLSQNIRTVIEIAIVPTFAPKLQFKFVLEICDGHVHSLPIQIRETI